MATPPLVSVIIPTYNRARLIGETLDSVLAQTYQHWECIIVDDGSTDNTDEVLGGYVKRDTRFQYRQRPAERPKGANACRNYGFEVCEGEYVIFLDSDDLLADNCLKGRLREFSTNPTSIDAIIANTYKWNSKNGYQKLFNIDPEISTKENYLIFFLNYRLPWHTMSVMWTRSFINKISFDETLHRFQDVDFHIRILNLNDFNFKRLKESDNFFRNSTEDKKNIKNEYNHNVRVSFEKIILKSNDWLHTSQRKKAFKRFLYVISRDFIFYNKQTDRELASLFFHKIKQYKLLDFKDLIHFRIMYLYKITNTYNKKGYGVLKFRRYANKYYNNLTLLKNG